MCGFAGFYNPNTNYLSNRPMFNNILSSMADALYHRGPDEQDIYLTNHFGLAHTRLSIIDLEKGQQPMMLRLYQNTYGIVYNGEIYNCDELRKDLINKGWHFTTTSDTEILLVCYVQYGPDFIKRVNGIFAFAIMDSREDSLYLYRDQMGVKPAYYWYDGKSIVFSSEMKGIFQYPDINPCIDSNGLNEIFSLGPAKSYGSGVFKDINEVLPGTYLRCNNQGIKVNTYWTLESKEHTDSYEDTLEKTGILVYDAIYRQMVSDVPICTFLSGGVDSSIVSAVCAKELKKKGKQLTTFSFDFKNNTQNFQANDFQPSQDRPYVEEMVKHIGSDHHFLECDSEMQTSLLYTSVDSRDLPTMADVDSSMLYFCSLVKDYNKVTLTGECADEIFGGYPWFHKEEFFKNNTFPWTPDLSPRKQLLKGSFLHELNMDEYVQNAYEKSIAEVPTLSTDNATEKRRRELSYLNMKWFMQTLLDRTDRTSMHSGLEARVPFADINIVEYLWNVPWDMKSKDGEVKSLLRNSCKELLPDNILYRRKSPYPKSYDPGYWNLLTSRLVDVMESPNAPINMFVDRVKILEFINAPSNTSKPWYGQLMAGPQMIAYLLQINYWIEKYNITIL